MSESTDYHVPVLLQEIIDMLVVNKTGIYLDATLGGGGHFRAIAEVLDKEATLIGIDRDPQAIEYNQSRIQNAKPKVLIRHSRFSQFDKVLQKEGLEKIDGVLLDLGVSSKQIDLSERGFSYMKDAPLDMRMNPQEGISAIELISESDEDELAKILEEYGEVQNPKRMARTIKKCQESIGLATSSDLKACLEKEYGPNIKIKVLSKVFQALRIAVNGELDELRSFLDKILHYLAPNGRFAIISYHSLEDRIVKNFIRDKEQSCTCPQSMPVCICKKLKQLKRVTKKSVSPSEEEVRRNPRARSAHLRVAEKLGEAA